MVCTSRTLAPLPVIANITDIRPRAAIELGRFAKSLGLPAVAAGNVALPADGLMSLTGVLAIAGEATAGLAIGLATQIGFAAAVAAGETISNAMGLGFAAMAERAERRAGRGAAAWEHRREEGGVRSLRARQRNSVVRRDGHQPARMAAFEPPRRARHRPPFRRRGSGYP